MTIEIRYGDTTFLAEGEYEEVRQAIIDGKALEVIEQRCYPEDPIKKRISFFGDPDWVSVDL